MRIDIGKHGTQVTLTKREKLQLNEARNICVQLAKQAETDDCCESNAAAELGEVIAIYCEPEEAGEGK